MKDESKKKFNALATKANLDRVDSIAEFSRITRIKLEREAQRDLLITEINETEAKVAILDTKLKTNALYSGKSESLRSYGRQLKKYLERKSILLEKLRLSDKELKKTEERLEKVRNNLILTQSKMSKISKISESKTIGEIETNFYIEESNQLEQSTSRPKKPS